MPPPNPAPALSPPSGLALHAAASGDIAAFNATLTASISSWNLKDRARRLAATALSYHPLDLEYMDMLIARTRSGEEVAVAAWEEVPLVDAPATGTALMLHGLFVVPGWQRRGVGDFLVEEGVQMAHRRGAAAVVTRAWRDSVGFFERAGFRAVGAGADLAANPLRMWRPLA